ncbi:MAG: phage head-tail adaptor, putative, family [Cypionkella sp.]|uniref:phage head closure protein n=1 Tax=Cypionkella sp. TaxID=2811411 RepID=UPI00263677DF|nr:phage head closure protein [Cypionkella sp.]MDB5659559.1 phage head-tail adaptor, putative, family [Cypionkella sp.]
MEAGKLDRIITVQRGVETVLPGRVPTIAWTNLLTVRAEVREQNADEIATGFGQAEAETLIFVVRWHPTPITTGDRILFQGRTYDLKAITEIGRRDGWKLRAVGVVL